MVDNKKIFYLIVYTFVYNLPFFLLKDSIELIIIDSFIKGECKNE